MNTRSPLASGQIRIGIAGLGRAGWGLHVHTLAQMRDRYAILAVVDPLADRREEAREWLGCAVYPDLSSMCADPDIEFVVVATPSRTHAESALTALRHGKHVLVEKPFAMTRAEADAMFTAAEGAGRLLISSQNQRYTADFLKVREVIDSGKLGTIVEVKITWHAFRRRWDWQTLRRHGGGTIYNDGSHVVDQALLLLGEGEPEVWSRLVRTPLCLGDAEDHVKILLTARGSPVVDLEFSNVCTYPQDRWLVLGSRGGLTGGATGLRWRYVEADSLLSREVSEAPPADRDYQREDLRWIDEDCDLSDEVYVASHARMYEALYGTLRAGQPLPITPASIKRQVSILESCHTATVDEIQEMTS